MMPTDKKKSILCTLALLGTSIFLLVGCGENPEETAKKLGFENKEQMYKIQGEGWHTYKKYQEDQALLLQDQERARDEKKWSIAFSSISDYLSAVESIKTNRVPESRAAEFLKMGTDKWLALMELERQEADAKREAEERAKLMDADYLQKTFGTEAGIYCRSAVERLAKYNFEWFDRWYETKFDSYITKVFQPGVLIVAGDKIKFQNGFGAWQIMSYRCEFDTQSKKVLNASAQAR